MAKRSYNYNYNTSRCDQATGHGLEQAGHFVKDVGTFYVRVLGIAFYAFVAFAGYQYFFAPKYDSAAYKQFKLCKLTAESRGSYSGTTNYNAMIRHCYNKVKPSVGNYKPFCLSHRLQGELAQLKAEGTCKSASKRTTSTYKAAPAVTRTSSTYRPNYSSYSTSNTVSAKTCTQQTDAKFYQMFPELNGEKLVPGTFYAQQWKELYKHCG